MTEAWRRRAISNFDYLCLLNFAAGRTQCPARVIDESKIRSKPKLDKGWNQNYENPSFDIAKARDAFSS